MLRFLLFAIAIVVVPVFTLAAVGALVGDAMEWFHRPVGWLAMAAVVWAFYLYDREDIERLMRRRDPE
jgi:hypothetical protein